MKSISSTLKQKIIDNECINSYRIEFLDNNIADITDENIESESMQLTQAVSDGARLIFGGCIASELQLTLLNTATNSDSPQYTRNFDESLEGQWFELYLVCKYKDSTSTLFPSSSLYPSSTLYPGEASTYTTGEVLVFSGFISSIKKDRDDPNRYNLIAYDLMHKLLGKSAKPYLDGALIYNSELTIDMILDHISTLFPIQRTKFFEGSSGISGRTYGTFNFKHANMEYGDISYGDLLRFCCEIAGLFAVIDFSYYAVDYPNTYGMVKIIELGCGAYPKPYGDTSVYPANYPSEVKQDYEYYEDMKVDEVTEYYTAATFNRTDSTGGDTGDPTIKVPLKDSAGSDGWGFIYDFSKNPLVYGEKNSNPSGYPCYYFMRSGKTNTRLKTIVPPAIIKVEGYPWIDPGDCIRVKYYDKYPNGKDYGAAKRIKTYVLKRVLTGCNALTDEITINGGNQVAIDERS